MEKAFQRRPAPVPKLMVGIVHELLQSREAVECPRLLPMPIYLIAPLSTSMSSLSALVPRLLCTTLTFRSGECSENPARM